MIKAIILSLKSVWETDKFRVIYELIYNILKQFFNVYYGVYFLRTLLVYIEMGKDLLVIVQILCFMLVVNIIFYFTHSHFKKIYVPCFDTKFSENIYKKIVVSASHVPYDIYNSPNFLDKYNRIVRNTTKNMKKILGSLGTLAGIIVALVMVIVYIIPLDPFALLWTLLPLVYTYFICEKSEVYQFELDKKTTVSNRKKEYAERIFYLPRFAKEIKTTSISKAIKAVYDEGTNESIAQRKKIGPKIAFFKLIELCVGDVLVIMLPIAYVAIRVMTGTSLSIGDFVGIAQSINYFGWDIEWFFDMILDIKSASLYINEYANYLETCSNQCEANISKSDIMFDDSLGFSLLCKNVAYSYPGTADGCYALYDINLEIKKGEKIAIVGENGSGKTTLVYLLMHLLSCTEGSINLAGHNIEEFSPEQLNNMFGVIFQDYHLYPISVRDNIDLNGTLKDDEIWSALKKLNLGHLISDLNTPITREFSNDGLELSGGQQQKLAMARIIANKYPFVILDEPTSSLDPLAEKEIYQLLSKELSDRTLIFISHRLSTTRFVDRIFVLKNGRIIESGNHKQLMEANGYYRYLYTLQESMYKE